MCPHAIPLNRFVLLTLSRSIDYATDSQIQDTIRELTSTIITIAHRLQTICDYDKVLVLDKGSVIEYAHPWELMQKKDGSFRSMCDSSGEYELLAKAAKKAWKAKHELVDVDEDDEDKKDDGDNTSRKGSSKDGAAAPSA